MQINQNFYGHLIPFCPLPNETIQISHLLTFEQNFCYRIEKLVFDANDSLDKVHQPRANFYIVSSHKSRFRQVNTQLKNLYQELGLLIGDLNGYTQ